MKEKEHYWIRWQKDIKVKKNSEVVELVSDHEDSIQDCLKVVEKLLKRKDAHNIKICKTYSLEEE